VDIVAGRDIKFLSDLSTEDADKMIGMGADEDSAVSREFVSNPTAAGHCKILT
jgi:hypothetical protein